MASTALNAWRLAACSVLAAASPAAAQQLDQFLSPDIAGVANEAGVTVTARRRPDYESGGVRAGAFIIRPRLVEGVGYESNVLGTPRPRGSPVVDTDASLEVASDVSRVSVTAALTLNDVRFLDQPRQSYTNWTARLGGSYEIGRDLVSAEYAHLNLNQTVRDLDVPDRLDQSLTYRVDVGRLAYRATFNRLSLTPAVELSSYAYGSGTSASASFRQDYRDRLLVTPSLTAAYEFSPRRSAVLIVRNSTASYSNQAPGLPRRDYNDAAVLAGLDYDVTGLFRVRALAGYEVRSFDARQYKTIQSPVAELSATWTPTGLTTVTASIARRIQDSSDETTAGYTATFARLRVDHEYLRNVLLQANAGVYHNEYRGGGDQTLYALGAGATYLLNRNVGVSATYDFLARTSGSSGNNGSLGLTGRPRGDDFISNRALLQVRFSL